MTERYSVDSTPAIARALLNTIDTGPTATVLGLSGDLGAGKTTLVQSIAKELGIVESVVSPTFVIAKFYETNDNRFTHLIHIDAYRIDDPSELETLGWEAMRANPNTLIVIEWPERIAALLDDSVIRYQIEHDADMRRIKRV